MTGEERASLCDLYARRRNWPELWRIARDLPVIEAVTAAHACEPAWRPEEDVAGLFARLRAADPRRLKAAAARLVSVRTVSSRELWEPQPGEPRVEIVRGRPRVSHLALSPDGSRLAAAAWPPAAGDAESFAVRHQRRPRLMELALPSGRLIRQESLPSPLHRHRNPVHWDGLLHLGGTVLLAVCNDPLGVRSGGSLYRYPDGADAGNPQAIHVAAPPLQVMTAMPTPHGFVAAVVNAAVSGERLRRQPDRRRLLFGDRDGVVRREVDVSVLGIANYLPGTLAADPDSGLLALAYSSRRIRWQLVLLDAEATKIVARSRVDPRVGHVESIVFTRSDELVTVHSAWWSHPGRVGHIVRWRRTRRTLRPLVSREMERATRGATMTEMHDPTASISPVLIALPAHHQVVIRARDTNFCNAGTLEPVTPPFGIDPRHASRLWSTRSGEHLAVMTGTGEIEVRGRWPDPVLALVERPLADARQQDLAVVRQAAGRLGGADDEVRQLVELLGACLEYRLSTG